MADKKQADRGFRIFIGILVILLILCIALFIYGSATNGVVQPKLPGMGIFALRTMLHG